MARHLVDTGTGCVLRRMRAYDVPENQNFIQTVQEARPIADIIYLPIRTSERLFGFWGIARAGLGSPYYIDDEVALIGFIVDFLNDAFQRSLLPPPAPDDVAYLDIDGRVISSGRCIQEAFEELFGKDGAITTARSEHWRSRARFGNAFAAYRGGDKRIGVDRVTLQSKFGEYRFLFGPYAPQHLAVGHRGVPWAYVRLLEAPYRLMLPSPVRSAEWVGLETLTPRERQVASCVYQGWSNKEIAYALKIDEGTVKRYTHSIYEKSAVHSRVEFVLRRRPITLN